MWIYRRYKQYNSVYISPKQNYLVSRTFPKVVVGSCCNFYKHRIRLKKCNESDLFA